MRNHATCYASLTTSFIAYEILRDIDHPSAEIRCTPSSPRQATGFVESLLRLIGLDWAALDFSAPRCRQETLKVNSPCLGSDGAAGFALRHRCAGHPRQ